jgi:stage II sporulation protein D
VDATRGQILTYELSPIEAYFHASCGGRTESGLAALNRDLPYLKSVDCPCAHTASMRWSLWLSEPEIEGVFHQHGPISVESRSSTGRARRVHVGGRSLDAVSFRERVGYDRVKSLSFDVEKAANGAFLLSGKGYGHGAGLCQWGAKAFADQGLDYRRILAHYYPGTELQGLY